MPVRNKKKSDANRQKAEQVRHLKQFVNEIKDLIAKAAGPDIAHSIPQYEIESLYNIRCHPVRLIAAPGESIPANILEFANHMVTIMFKGKQTPIGVGTLDQMSLYDFFSTGYTVMLYANAISDENFACAARIKKALAPLAALFGSPIHTAALSNYNSIMVTISLFCSDINEHLYAFKYNPAIKARGISKAGLFSEIYRVRLPKVKVLIEEHLRPALQLGWYLPEPELHLKLSSIRSEEIYQPPGKMLGVYIQSHALNRLAERLDGVDTGVLHYNIFDSISNLKVCRNKMGILFFEYAIFGNKTGYFLGEVVKDKVVLKTFLFLTNSGTPEADRLQRSMGLMKEDINYLAIDKLSAFLLSDIADNERVKQLFVDAGCASLFEMDKEYIISSDGLPAASKAELIVKYLQLDATPSP